MTPYSPLKIVSSKRHGSILKILFLVDPVSSATVPPYSIDDYVLVNFGIQYHYDISIMKYMIHFKKQESAKHVTVTMKLMVSTITERLQELMILTCMESWCSQVVETKALDPSHTIYQIEISLEVNKTEDSFRSKLYEDDRFTDFKLCAEDGSIGIHRSIMAIHSDMLDAMLGGTWKETEEKSIKMKGVTKQTLQHFKDYMYLGIVPEDMLHLRSLVLLSRYYLMDDLQKKCTMKLIHTITPENFLQLLDFSRHHGLSNLTCAILQLTPDEVMQASYNLEASNPIPDS